jgi:hypothetical protein
LVPHGLGHVDARLKIRVRERAVHPVGHHPVDERFISLDGVEEARLVLLRVPAAEAAAPALLDRDGAQPGLILGSAGRFIEIDDAALATWCPLRPLLVHQELVLASAHERRGHAADHPCVPRRLGASVTEGKTAHVRHLPSSALDGGLEGRLTLVVEEVEERLVRDEREDPSGELACVLVVRRRVEVVVAIFDAQRSAAQAARGVEDIHERLEALVRRLELLREVVGVGNDLADRDGVVGHTGRRHFPGRAPRRAGAPREAGNECSGRSRRTSGDRLARHRRTVRRLRRGVGTGRGDRFCALRESRSERRFVVVDDGERDGDGDDDQRDSRC